MAKRKNDVYMDAVFSTLSLFLLNREKREKELQE